MSPLFGTDGVRGIPGKFPLTETSLRRLGYVAARVFLENMRYPRSNFHNGTAPRILMGRDTRISGPSLSRWLSEGFAHAGCATWDAGIVPTPAVAYLTPRLGALCGVVISASHNPQEFNGIKFFTSLGFKAPVELEQRMEQRLAASPNLGSPQGKHLRTKIPWAVQGYMEFLRSTFPPTADLSGMRLVVDAAHGAAYQAAPALLRSLGAEVFLIGCRPNGRNINRGVGALATEAMRREVLRRGAQGGISLDGDADRAILADERGCLLNGDNIIALAAVDMHNKGLLRGDKVVLTVMSNFGLIRYLEQQKISVIQVPVGDRNVTDALESGKFSLGGESSGHIVFRRLAGTGDGLLTCLQALAVAVESGRPLSAFRSLYKNYPQILRNVHVHDQIPMGELPEFARCVQNASQALKGRGRVFVRYSGTEPVLRILVEGPSRSLIRKISDRLVLVFRREISRVFPSNPELQRVGHHLRRKA